MEGIFYAKAAGYIASALAIGLGAMGAAYGQGMVGAEACRNIGKYPEHQDKIRTMALIGMAFIESCPVYAFLTVIFILFGT